MMEASLSLTVDRTEHANEHVASRDGVLVRRAQAGDVAAFTSIVLAYERRVQALARRAAGAASDAEDIAQEAFVRAWRSIDRFDAARPLAPWLFTITVRVARTHHRRERRRAILHWRWRGPVGAESAPVSAPADRDDARSLWDAVDRLLGPDARMALWLTYGESLRSPAVGAAMGLSDVAVRAVLSRARRTLREQLDQEMFHDR